MQATWPTLSMLVTKDYRDHWEIPSFDEIDSQRMSGIVKQAITKINKRINEAYEVLNRLYINPTG